MGVSAWCAALLGVVVVAASCGTTSTAIRPAATPSPTPSAAATASASPSGSPVPSPPPDFGPPPPGVDLFYLIYPGYPTWLIGYDWSGTPRATVHLSALDGHTDAIGSGITVAPNGDGFWSGFFTFDRRGGVIFQGAPPTKGTADMVWSEDGAVLCGASITSAIDQNGNGTADFYFVRATPTTSPVMVSRFLHLDVIPGDMGFTMFACSHWLDRALIVRTVCCGISGALVVRISDGAILGTWSRDGGEPAFSPDGQEVADPMWTADGRTLSTEVRLVLGGTVLARYGPDVEFKAFSATNRLAVVKAGGQTEVIEVGTRRVVWRDTQGRTLASVWPRPFSGDLALAFTAPPVQIPCPNASSSPCTNPLVNLVVVHADGSSVAIPGDHLMPMTWGWMG